MARWCLAWTFPLLNAAPAAQSTPPKMRTPAIDLDQSRHATGLRHILLIRPRRSERRQARRVDGHGRDALDLDQPVRSADGAVDDQGGQSVKTLGEVALDTREIPGIAEINDEVHHVVDSGASRAQQRIDVGERP